MEPVVEIEAPPPPPPTDNALVRGFRALLVERRLPYNVQMWLDAWAPKWGFPLRTSRVGGLAFTIRRDAARQNPDERVVRNIVEHEEYCRPGYEISPGDVVIDIGANIGAFSLYALRVPNTRVYSVEPDPENFSLLSRNVSQNAFTDRSVRLQAAVAAERGTVRLNFGSAGIVHSTMDQHRNDALGSVQVDATTIADLFEGHKLTHCDLFKIDCEGAEWTAFAALPDEILTRIERLVMEWHGIGDLAERRALVQDFIGRLQRLGFQIDHFSQFAQEYMGGHLFARQRPSADRKH